MIENRENSSENRYEAPEVLIIKKLIVAIIEDNEEMIGEVVSDAQDMGFDLEQIDRLHAEASTRVEELERIYGEDF